MTRDAEPALQRAALVLADSVRVLGALSVLVAVIWRGPVELSLFLLVLLGLVVPRVFGAPALLDLALGVTLLAAGWFAVLDAFAAVGPLDLVVHCAANGLLAVTAYLLLVRLGAVPDPAGPGPVHHGFGTVVVVTALGVLLGLLWELGEWAGHTYVDPGINVGYEDTLGDLAAGGIGSLVAGILVVRAAARHAHDRHALSPMTASTDRG